MPNIYLRLPTSRCQFLRHRDDNHTLAPDEPLVFSLYMPEYHILRNCITNVSAVTQRVNILCFSHQQWTNMTYGRAPTGGKPMMKRNHTDWLTYDEIQQLNGQQERGRTEKEDYLCIKLPSEVMVVDAVRHVTPTWNLNYRGVRQLSLMLNADFKRAVVEWVLSTFDYCTANGRIICRGHSAMLERFLMRYGIEPTVQEKDNLRRVIDRWIRTEHGYFNVYSCSDMQFTDPKERVQTVDVIEWL